MPLLGIYAASVQKASTAFESIATATGNGSSTTFTFSSIPGTYQHLQLRVLTLGTTNSGTSPYIRFNSDSGANYSRHFLYGTGTSAVAFGSSSDTFTMIGGWVNGMHSTYPIVNIIDIHDYASTSKNKTVRVFAGQDLNGSGSVELMSGVWMSTSAITSITITGSAFTTTSTAALYGIKGA